MRGGCPAFISAGGAAGRSSARLRMPSIQPPPPSRPRPPPTRSPRSSSSCPTGRCAISTSSIWATNCRPCPMRSRREANFVPGCQSRCISPRGCDRGRGHHRVSGRQRRQYRARSDRASTAVVFGTACARDPRLRCRSLLRPYRTRSESEPDAPQWSGVHGRADSADRGRAGSVAFSRQPPAASRQPPASSLQPRRQPRQPPAFRYRPSAFSLRAEVRGDSMLVSGFGEKPPPAPRRAPNRNFAGFSS